MDVDTDPHFQEEHFWKSNIWLIWYRIEGRGLLSNRPFLQQQYFVQCLPAQNRSTLNLNILNVFNVQDPFRFSDPITAKPFLFSMQH